MLPSFDLTLNQTSVPKYSELPLIQYKYLNTAVSTWNSETQVYFNIHLSSQLTKHAESQKLFEV